MWVGDVSVATVGCGWGGIRFVWVGLGLGRVGLRLGWIATELRLNTKNKKKEEGKTGKCEKKKKIKEG